MSENQEESKELDFQDITEQEYQEYIWSLKRAETVTDVDGTEYKLSFLPLIL